MAKKNSKSGDWKFYPQKPEKQSPSILNRFVDRIRSTFQKFQNKPEHDFHLTGRIQDLQKTANSVLEQLSTIKDEMRKEIDKDVFSHVEDVIDIMIKEVSRLHQSMERPGSVTHHAKTYQRYSQWIEKAKLWVQICSMANDKEAIVKAIIRYTVDDFLQVIDRDIQVINDYQEHMLDALAVEEDEKIALAQRLDLRLDPYLKALSALHVKPRDLPLQEIALWKAQVDKRREKYFEAALHAIDKIINDIIPDTSGPEEHEHLAEVLTQIAYLETETPNIYDDIFMVKKPNAEQRKKLEARITTLEHEIHQLNLDLRLTPDLINRLQVLTEMLNQARMKLME